MVIPLSDPNDHNPAQLITFPRPTPSNGEALREGENPSTASLLENVITQIAQGDRLALDRLYRLTSPRLMSIAHFYLGGSDEAEDVLHDVYMSVWRKASSYRVGRSRPMGWLTAITRNRCLDRLRYRLRRPQAAPESLAAIPDETTDALTRIENEENGRRLLQCMDRLADDQRHAVRLSFYGGHTYEATARALDIPLPTLKSRIRRALLLMRQCLQP